MIHYVTSSASESLPGNHWYFQGELLVSLWLWPWFLQNKVFLEMKVQGLVFFFFFNLLSWIHGSQPFPHKGLLCFLLNQMLGTNVIY